MNKAQIASVVALVIVVLAVGAFEAPNFTGATETSTLARSGTIQVVAAENFWGSLVAQVGGNRVNVLSIVTDPNADPHEYSSNAANAAAVANASLVIVNGDGYDSWALSLISAAGATHQTVLDVQQLLGLPLGVNPHFWYSPYYVNDTVRAMYLDLVAIDPTDGPYFRSQYAALNMSLAGTEGYNTRIREIATQFSGTKVAATEDIFTYLANATKLDLISPPEFMQAVAEGGDPTPASVAEFQTILENKSVALLVYNQQTVTPLTSSMKALAAQNDIPVVGVTETIQPPDVSFQFWMNSQLIYLQNALNSNALAR